MTEVDRDLFGRERSGAIILVAAVRGRNIRSAAV
jgi:hypothetical protein